MSSSSSKTVVPSRGVALKMTARGIDGLPRDMNMLVCSFLSLPCIYSLATCSRTQRTHVTNLPPSLYSIVSVFNCAVLDPSTQLLGLPVPLLWLRPHTLRLAPDSWVRVVELDSLALMSSSLMNLTLWANEPPLSEGSDEKGGHGRGRRPPGGSWNIDPVSLLTSLTSLTVRGFCWEIGTGIRTLTRLRSLHVTAFDFEAHGEEPPETRKTYPVLPSSLTSLYYDSRDDETAAHLTTQTSPSEPTTILSMPNLRHLSTPRQGCILDPAVGLWSLAGRMLALESLHVRYLSLASRHIVRIGEPASTTSPPLFPHLTRLITGIINSDDMIAPIETIGRLGEDMPSLVSLSLLEIDLGPPAAEPGDGDDGPSTYEYGIRRQNLVQSMVTALRSAAFVSSLQSLTLEGTGGSRISRDHISSLLAPPPQSSEFKAGDLAATTNSLWYQLTSLDLRDSPPSLTSLISLPKLSHLRTTGFPVVPAPPSSSSSSSSMWSSLPSSSSSPPSSVVLSSLLSLEISEPDDTHLWPSPSMVAIHYPSLTSFSIATLQSTELESIAWPIVSAVKRLRFFALSPSPSRGQLWQLRLKQLHSLAMALPPGCSVVRIPLSRWVTPAFIQLFRSERGQARVSCELRPFVSGCCNDPTVDDWPNRLQLRHSSSTRAETIIQDEQDLSRKIRPR